MQESTLEQGKVVAFIDLGSNSVRLFLVRIKSNASYVILNQVKYMVRLGEDSFQTKKLQAKAIERTILVVKSFAQMCESYKATEIIAMATAAVRDANNSQEFINKCYEETGIKFAVISGQEEARLIYLGINSELEKSEHLRLFIDIGGGSTEIILADSTEYKELYSLQAGCVRLTNQFLKNEADKVSPTEYNNIVSEVRIKSARINFPAITEAYGSSGTIESLAQLNTHFKGLQVEEDDEAILSLKYIDLVKISKKLCAMTLQERKNLPIINENRAEVIVAGAAILQSLMQTFNLEKIQVSKRTLQHGMLMDYLYRNYPNAFNKKVSTREQSVMQLARFCRSEEKHIFHVAKLCLELFESSKANGIHSYDIYDRELLYYSALLHDIGIFISYINHNAHSYYLIENTEILGFTKSEINIVSALAFFHRKKASKKYHIFNAFSEQKQKLIEILSLFLTLAERMDRSHRQVIHSAHFIKNSKEIILELKINESCPIELDYLERTQKQIQKVLNSPIKIVEKYANSSS